VVPALFRRASSRVWLAAKSDEETSREVDYLERTPALPAGGSVLDVPCGGGRHVLGLAARGYRGTGVDLSSEYMSIARARAKAQGLSATFEQRDMSQLSFDNEFDGAYCFGNSFGYLDDDGNARFLSGVARALRPGGRFVLETYMLAESLFPDFHEKAWHEAGGIFCAMRGDYDPATARVDNECTFVKDGMTTRSAFSVRIYGYRELCELCRRSGFSSTEATSGVSGEPFRLGSDRLLLVASTG